MSDGIFYTFLAVTGVLVLLRHFSSNGNNTKKNVFIKQKLLEDLNKYEENEEYEKCEIVKRQLEEIDK